MSKGGTTKWSRKRRRKEILLYKELHPLATLTEIGEQFGVTKQYISQFLRSNNIVQGKAKRRKDSRRLGTANTVDKEPKWHLTEYITQ